MAIFGFLAKNEAKIGVIIKNLHFWPELHALSTISFAISKLSGEYIFDNFSHVQGAAEIYMPWKRVNEEVPKRDKRFQKFYMGLVVWHKKSIPGKILAVQIIQIFPLWTFKVSKFQKIGFLQYLQNGRF